MHPTKGETKVQDGRTQDPANKEKALAITGKISYDQLKAICWNSYASETRLTPSNTCI
jgi:hypothetical protein